MCQFGAIDSPNDRGDTALILAVKAQKLEIAKMLLKYTSDVNQLDGKSRNLLDLAPQNDDSYMNLLFGSGFKSRSPEEIRYRREYVQAQKLTGLSQVDLDYFVQFCRICDVEFNFKVRKSHCRKCGRICCRECIGVVSENENGIEKQVKVCKDCQVAVVRDYQADVKEVYQAVKEVFQNVKNLSQKWQKAEKIDLRRVFTEIGQIEANQVDLIQRIQDIEDGKAFKM